MGEEESRDTYRPPPNQEGDAYSAATVLREIPRDLLARAGGVLRSLRARGASSSSVPAPPAAARPALESLTAILLTEADLVEQAPAVTDSAQAAPAHDDAEEPTHREAPAASREALELDAEVEIEVLEEGPRSALAPPAPKDAPGLVFLWTLLAVLLLGALTLHLLGLGSCG